MIRELFQVLSYRSFSLSLFSEENRGKQKSRVEIKKGWGDQSRKREGKKRRKRERERTGKEGVDNNLWVWGKYHLSTLFFLGLSCVRL